MLELTKKQLEKIYPNRYKDVNFLSHFFNEGDRKDLKIAPCRRLLNGVVKIKNLKRIVIGVDDKTTDNTLLILEEFKNNFPQFQWIVFLFKWKHDFSYAKNMLIWKAEQAGMREGEWICIRGGDFSMSDSFIKKYGKFTENPENVVGRVNVPEHSSWIKNHAHQVLKNWFPLFWEVHRDRIIDWRHRKDIKFRNRVHENMYQDFYGLTHMGDYFAKHHGVPLIGTVFHHAKQEDTLEIAQRKIFYYLVLTYCDKVEGCYGITGDLDEKNKKIMALLSKTKEEKLAASKGWNFWINFMTEKYLSGSLPEGLYQYYQNMFNARMFMAVYG